MASNAAIAFPIQKIHAGRVTAVIDQLAVEEPLEIQIQYNTNTIKKIAVTMRTPGNDEELAAGFLFTEGIISNGNSIQSIKHVEEDKNIIRVTLHPGITPHLDKSERNFYTTSSCGVCGKASIDAIKAVSPFPPPSNSITISEDIIYTLPYSLQAEQAIFYNTGGLHASALFTTEGKFDLIFEDVGRHNALDKLVGHCLLYHRLPLNDSVLLLSGRGSFELIQKAAMAGITVVIAIGAPSSLAVALAAENNITLAGFLRRDQFNIYSGMSRIKTSFHK